MKKVLLFGITVVMSAGLCAVDPALLKINPKQVERRKDVTEADIEKSERIAEICRTLCDLPDDTKETRKKLAEMRDRGRAVDYLELRVIALFVDDVGSRFDRGETREVADCNVFCFPLSSAKADGNGYIEFTGRMYVYDEEGKVEWVWEEQSLPFFPSEIECAVIERETAVHYYSYDNMLTRYLFTIIEPPNRNFALK